MNHGAYLVAKLRRDGTFRLEIFSEPCPSRMDDQPTAVVGSAHSAIGYQEARDDLVREIRRGKWGRWILAFMGESLLNPPMPKLP